MSFTVCCAHGLPSRVKGEHFTGLNNFEINSIVDIDHDEQFSFTDDERS